MDSTAPTNNLNWERKYQGETALFRSHESAIDLTARLPACSLCPRIYHHCIPRPPHHLPICSRSRRPTSSSNRVRRPNPASTSWRVATTRVESTMVLSIDGQATTGEEERYQHHVAADTDYTHTFVVDGRSPDTAYAYRVQCIRDDDATPSSSSRSVDGSFRTVPSPHATRAVSFVWASCLSGQGYGRNPDFEIVNADGEIVRGGYVVFDTMEKLAPDFAIFQGDMVYADNAIPAVRNYTNGTEYVGTWYNNPTKDFVAVSLEDFRANWKYNHGDEKMQSFLSKIPIYVQWDDHEVTNNWWPGEILGEPAYENDTAANDLAEVSLRALLEFNPINQAFVYRSQQFGEHLEVFFPDFRTYRGPNTDNIKPSAVDMMGEDQLNWLKDGLSRSTATWKLISAHDPFGIVTGSGPSDYDSFANEDPAILGREFEMKDLLSYIHDNDIANVVSISSDVHFAAHVSMSPERAEGNFSNFKQLEEFLIGPIHGGAFGPNYMDASFGAAYEFEYGPLTLGYDRWASLAPEIVRLQSFGHASVSEDGELTIKLINIDGNVLYEKTMTPESTTDGSSSSSDNSTGSADNSASFAGSDSTITCSMWAIYMVMFGCIMAVG
ncbi:hypothetical protein ACHAW5_006615 [Stephanodiscus triporus]|uniref:PhoD-like phosphatase metallophosphatase domain-containing protein n=1 Tax=Stephanodiscus triporus TaxID=2934178 RepID=A0ABD3PKB6_9STRA